MITITSFESVLALKDVAEDLYFGIDHYLHDKLPICVSCIKEAMWAYVHRL
jgi:hypothetical protein